MLWDHVDVDNTCNIVYDYAWYDVCYDVKDLYDSGCVARVQEKKGASRTFCSHEKWQQLKREFDDQPSIVNYLEVT